MKKNHLLLLTVMLLGTFTAFAQDETTTLSAFKKGSTTIGLAAGFGVKYNYYVDAKPRPAFAFIIDKAAIDNVGPGIIGFGGHIGYRGSRYDYSGGDYARWDDVILAFRATYHLTILKDKNNHFDPYAGIVLGARYTFYTDTYSSDYSYNNVYFVKGIFVGAKYNFSRGFGAFVEFGFDVSNFRIGLNFNTRNK